MREIILRKASGFILMLLGAALLFAPQVGWSQWQQIVLEGGGVIEDLVKVDVNGDDVVWAAGMGSGLFRTKWLSGTPGQYDDWVEYQPGKGFFGVDAIYTGGTEYVLGGSGDNGVRGASSSNGSFTNWNWPNYDYYPEALWKEIRAHDVAFWCNENETYPNDPFSQYLVIFLDIEDRQPNYNSGLYKWDHDLLQFDRVDAALPTSPDRGFTHFFRDMDDENVVYLTADDGVFKLSGSYDSIKFEKLPNGTKVEDLNIDKALIVD